MTYTVTVKGGLLGAKDLAGNALGGDFSGEFRARDYGDVSGNGVLTALDAALVLQHVVGLITLSAEAQFLACFKFLKKCVDTLYSIEECKVISETCLI
jgi:hypothetical protein